MDVPQKLLDWNTESLYQAGKNCAPRGRVKDCQLKLCKQQFICFVGVFLLCKHVLRPSDWYMLYKLEI